MTGLAALAGVLAVAGVWTVVVSWRRAPVVERTRSRSTARFGLWDQRRVLAAGAGALVGLVVTRWPVALVAGGVIGWLASEMTGARQRRQAEARTEAIALWAEMLRDAIGSARGVEGVLLATASTAPLPIRTELGRMASRLEYEPLDSVLDDLAEDLDHPVGDLVVTALRLTSTTGGRQVRNVLSDLAAAAYTDAESHRRVEVARERPRSALRYTAIVIGAFVVLLIVFSRTYLEPYRSALGQVVLSVVAAYWAVGFWWMHRMARPVPVERFLARRNDDASTGV